MRELQVCPPSKRGLAEDRVRRLEFRARGGEMVAWVGTEEMTRNGRAGYTQAIRVYDFAAGAAHALSESEELAELLGWEERTPDPVLSPDGRILLYEGWDEPILSFTLISGPDNGQRQVRPSLPTGSHGLGGLVFAPDGAELIAVRNEVVQLGRLAPDVARVSIRALTEPPKRFVERTNPLNGKSYNVPVYDVRWRVGAPLPLGERATVASLSADGRLIAVGGDEGGLVVADLKGKRPRTFPWTGRPFQDRSVVRVAFGPDAERVVTLANGRLFAHPLGTAAGWQTPRTLGYAHDFAFHPTEQLLCAVFADGRARYLDPRTGAVRRTFQWGQKALYSVAFTPDGLTCAAGGVKGKVVMWDVDAL